MANIKSQIKRNKQAVVRKTRNKSTRSELKTLLGKFQSEVESADKSTATIAYVAAAKALDKAAAKNIIHRNNAGNKKSAMSRKLNQLEK